MTYLINLSEHKAFDSVQEMNYHVKQLSKEVSKTYYNTYMFLTRYSCKCVGVSHLKKETIAGKLNLSLRTVKRHLDYLKANHFITVVGTSRIKRGGDGANIYIINSLERRKQLMAQNDTPQMTPRKDTKKDGKSLSQQAMEYVRIKKETIFFKAIKKSFNVTERKYNLYLKRMNNIKNFRSCPENVPEFIYKSNSAFFTDKQINSIYNVVLAQTEDCNLDTDEIDEIAVYTFKAIVIAMRDHEKYGKERIRNLFAYASKVARRKLVEVMERKTIDTLDFSLFMKQANF